MSPVPERRRRSPFAPGGAGYRALLLLLWGTGLGVVTWLAWEGRSYYATPLVERPRHPDYWRLKPGGEIGILLGVAGTALMVAMLSYSLRRRARPLRRAGPLRAWLDFHIFCGVLGPLLVVLHSSFKVGGLVGIAFWSMVVVAASGVVGRYLYVQIPRRRSGDALTLEEVEAESRELAERLAAFRTNGDELEAAEAEMRRGAPSPDRPLLLLLAGLPFEALARRRRLARVGRRWRRSLPRRERRSLLALLRRRADLERRIALWSRLHDAFHWWHVLHKPFALVMYLFVAVHVAVAVATGYATWSIGW